MGNSFTAICKVPSISSSVGKTISGWDCPNHGSSGKTEEIQELYIDVLTGNTPSFKTFRNCRYENLGQYFALAPLFMGMYHDSVTSVANMPCSGEKARTSNCLFNSLEWFRYVIGVRVATTAA